jgi:hypothetical protein
MPLTSRNATNTEHPYTTRGGRVNHAKTTTLARKSHPWWSSKSRKNDDFSAKITPAQQRQNTKKTPARQRLEQRDADHGTARHPCLAARSLLTRGASPALVVTGEYTRAAFCRPCGCGRRPCRPRPQPRHPVRRPVRPRVRVSGRRSGRPWPLRGRRRVGRFATAPTAASRSTVHGPAYRPVASLPAGLASLHSGRLAAAPLRGRT